MPREGYIFLEKVTRIGQVLGLAEDESLGKAAAEAVETQPVRSRRVPCGSKQRAAGHVC